MDPKRLVLENGNNCLALDVFLQINVAPPRSRLPHYEQIADQLYVVEHEGNQVFVRLIEIWFLKFREISSIDTLMVSGLRSGEWKLRFLEKHPETTEESEMAIYCYKKEKV